MENNKSVIDDIIKLENLHWAWEKVKEFYKDDNYWCDELEITSFQVHYEEELKRIKQDIKNGIYKLNEIKPIFFPKKRNEDDKPLNRQMFWVSIRDQLVWLAVMNVIGKYYDKQMPYWSYGNRLYINIFPNKEKSSSKKIFWEYGPYRNTTKKTYRSFGQSWPRYRKDIYITSKLMTKSVKDINDQLTNDEKEDIERNMQLHEIHQVKYKKKDFWSIDISDNIYWCSIDLSKFYPNTSTSVILNNFELYGEKIKTRYNDFERLLKLLESLLSFNIDYNIGIENAEFDKIGLEDKNKEFKGIPTGLFSAGFLSNIGMLHIDKLLNKVVERKSQHLDKVAIFRFVDDFTILSPNYHSIINLIFELDKLLKEEFSNSLKINKEKTKPDELMELLLFKNIDNENDIDKMNDLIEKAAHAMKIDSNFPTPLMNHTLKKVSTSNKIYFDLIDSDEEKKYIEDLEHLLVTDISEDEIRKDTRMSFASSRIATLVPKKKYDYTEIYNTRCKIKDIQDNIYKLENKKDKLDEETLKLKKEELKETENELVIKKAELSNEIQKDRKKVSILLEYAIVHFPDKLKLWKNLINFYKNIGFSKKSFLELLQVFKILKDMKNQNQINSYTHEYLITYLYGIISNAVISSIKSIKSENISHNDKQIKNSFLEQTFMDKVENALSSPEGAKSYNSFYFVQAKELLKISIEVSKSLYYEKYQFNIPLSKIHYCWIVNNFGANLSQPIVEKYFDREEFNSIYDSYLVSFYPDLIINDVNKFLLIDKYDYIPFSWWYKFVETNSLFNSTNLIQNKNAQVAVDLLSFQKEHKYLNIFSFIEKINYTEERALSIISKILNQYNDSNQDLFIQESKAEKIFAQFPYNIFIKNNKDIIVDIQNANGISFTDKRYFPEFVDFNYANDPEKQFIYGIGILLYQLISKDLDLLPQFYQPSMQLINSDYFVKELEKYPISTFSYEIIKACLSKRNREIKNLNIENEEYNDFVSDSENLIDISTIDGLQVYINEAIKYLKKQTYEYGNNKRTLIPKKLFELKQNFENSLIEEKSKDLKIGFIQVNFDSNAAWGPSNNITLSMKPEVESFVWQEILKGFHKMNNHHTKPDIIIIPELTIPLPYIIKLKELAKNINVVVFAGLEWFVDILNKEVENKAIMLVPNNWNTNLNSQFSNSTLLGKNNPSNGEKKTIFGFNSDYKFKPDDNMYIIDSGEYGKIGFAICADFYDIERFAVYKGRVQHIIILALNKDTNSFFAISEAVARLVMCNVVICNTGEFGDSLAFSPYKKDYQRMIYRNQGAGLFATQVVKLPVKTLIEDQKKGADINTIDESISFKMPPHYKFIH